MDTDPASFFSSFDEVFILELISFFVLLIFSAFVSGAEVAFFSLSSTEIDEASESKDKVANKVALLLENPEKLLATILISNNFINILIVLIFAFLGEQLFSGLHNTYLKFMVEVVLVTFLILLFGEVLPKVYANRNAMKFAMLMVRPIQTLAFVFKPLSTPLLGLTGVIESRLERKSKNFSVEKLSQALELTSDSATTKEEQKILEGIVSFGTTDTVQIMKSRVDVFAIADDESFEDVKDKVIKNGFSRNPIYKENIDQIIGVLYAKDLLPHLDKDDFEWQSLARETIFVPENKKLDDLLKEFQEKKIHLAVVVDEYGGTSGIVTLEDIIEEIVGDISDEFDDEGLFYSKLDDNNYVFEGKTSIKDLAKIIDVDEELFDDKKGDTETLAGFLLEISGKFPKKNEIIKFEHLTFKVEAMDRRRVKQVKVTIEEVLDDENKTA